MVADCTSHNLGRKWKGCGEILTLRFLLLLTLALWQSVWAGEPTPFEVARAARLAAETRNAGAAQELAKHIVAFSARPDGDYRRSARVCLDAMIQLKSEATTEVLDAAMAMGAEVEAVILASRSGEHAQRWARMQVKAMSPVVRGWAPVALMNLVAAQRTAEAAEALLPDVWPRLVISVSEPDPKDQGPLGLFGSRTGGGRKRSLAGEEWPKEYRYVLSQSGSEGEPLLNAVHTLRFIRMDSSKPGPDDTSKANANDLRINMLYWMAQTALERYVELPSEIEWVKIEFIPGSDVAVEVRRTIEQRTNAWQAFAGSLREAKLIESSEFPKPLAVLLLDCREAKPAPLPPVDGRLWAQLPPALRKDSEELRRLWEEERNRQASPPAP